MHPQGVVLNFFGSVRPERREGQRSKGRLVSSLRRLVVSSLRLVASSLRRLVASSRRLVALSRRLVVSSSRFRLVVSLSSRRLAFVSSSCFRFAGRGGGGGKKRGRWDELNQRGSKRPLEDALKSNFGRLLSTPPLKFSLVLPFLSTLLLGFFWFVPKSVGIF